MLEYGYLHTKRSRVKDGRPSYEGKPYAPIGTSNADQKAGNFSFDMIHGLELKEISFDVPSYEDHQRRRREFDGIRDPETNRLVAQGIRSEFLKMLANTREKELVEKLGLCPRDIDSMKKGYTPNGYNVHHKLPLFGGGKNEFKNFILTPKFPHDQWHRDVIDPQIVGIQRGESRKILLPWTDDMIYDPKKYGFTKENQPVQPNYTSNVNPANYPKLYKAEDISVAKRTQSMANYYAAIDRNNKPAAKTQAAGVARSIAAMRER